MQDELLKSFSGRIRIVTKIRLLLLGPGTAVLYCWNEYSDQGLCENTLSLCSSYKNYKNVLSIQHIKR